jgi:hypothetical protein
MNIDDFDLDKAEEEIVRAYQFALPRKSRLREFSADEVNAIYDKIIQAISKGRKENQTP